MARLQSSIIIPIPKNRSLHAPEWDSGATTHVCSGALSMHLWCNKQDFTCIHCVLRSIQHAHNDIFGCSTLTWLQDHMSCTARAGGELLCVASPSRHHENWQNGPVQVEGPMSFSLYACGRNCTRQRYLVFRLKSLNFSLSFEFVMDQRHKKAVTPRGLHEHWRIGS